MQSSVVKLNGSYLFRKNKRDRSVSLIAVGIEFSSLFVNTSAFMLNGDLELFFNVIATEIKFNWFSINPLIYLFHGNEIFFLKLQ